MIHRARALHPNCDFYEGSFPQDIDIDDTLFDTILFNGSLQFFDDTFATLAAAVERVPDQGGRIVVSHVQGAAFVRHECRTNPSVAVKYLPTQEQLQQWQRDLGVRLLEDAKDDDDFYLVVLEKV
jgi:hypothetical protein